MDIWTNAAYERLPQQTKTGNQLHLKTWGVLGRPSGWRLVLMGQNIPLCLRKSPTRHAECFPHRPHLRLATISLGWERTTSKFDHFCFKGSYLVIPINGLVVEKTTHGKEDKIYTLLAATSHNRTILWVGRCWMMLVAKLTAILVNRTSTQLVQNAKPWPLTCRDASGDLCQRFGSPNP